MLIRNAANTAKRILVVDDDASILLLTRTLLKRAGYHVDAAMNGRQALEMAHATHYDVIVLDLMMPEVNGHELLAGLAVRQQQARFAIIMSAASEDVIRKATGPNVFAALRKPFDIDTLTTAVAACIANEPAETAGPPHDADDETAPGIRRAS